MVMKFGRLPLLGALMIATACSPSPQAARESNVQQGTADLDAAAGVAPDPYDSNEVVSDQGVAADCANLYYAEPRHGPGICYPTGSYDGDCKAAVARFEGNVGRRVASFEPFSRGLVVTFQDGGQKALWNTLIDCKDPPSDPISSANHM